MSDLTPVSDDTPLSDSTDQPSLEATETVESLKEKLAVAEEEKRKAEEEAKTWKGRVKDENPKKKKEDISEADIDWKIANQGRISLVKDAYEQELLDLEASGAKITNAVREKALKYAESNLQIKTVSGEPLPAPSIDRSGSREPVMTESDIAFGVNPEIKKKYAAMVEGS